MLPFGVVEKHGPTEPLGTDLTSGRYVAEQATIDRADNPVATRQQAPSAG